MSEGNWWLCLIPVSHDPGPAAACELFKVDGHIVVAPIYMQEVSFFMRKWMNGEVLQADAHPGGDFSPIFRERVQRQLESRSFQTDPLPGIQGRWRKPVSHGDRFEGLSLRLQR